MKINEVTTQQANATVDAELAAMDKDTAAITATQQPPAEEIQAVTDFAKSVEMSKEPAATVLSKFNTFLAAHPMFDLVTDYIPQTRVIKALMGAADALEQKDGKSALASLSSLVTGAAGKAIDAGTRAVNVAGAVDDYKTATALAAKPVDQTVAYAPDELTRLRELAFKR